MKVLMIAPQPFFSPRGTPLSVYYRALVLSEMGVDIDLLTYGEGQDVILPNVKIYRIPRFAFLGRVEIGPSIFKMFLDIFLVLWTLKLLLKNRYDFVHAHEEAVFFCSFLKPILGFKLIYDMHSSLPQQLTNFRFTKSRFLIKLFQVLENRALKASDAVITICPDLASYVDSVISDKSKHVMIENSIFEPVQLKAQNWGAEYNRNPKGDSSTVIDRIAHGRGLVVYAGTLEAYQGMETLLQAFQEVLQQKVEAQLLIVGGTQRQVREYTDLSEKLGVDESVIFTGRVEHATAQQLCRLADVQISPRSSGTNTPLKIYEQLASGIPLVVTDIYSHTQAIDSKVAFFVEPEPKDMARGIIEALSSKSLCEEKTNAAKALYEMKYSRPVYERKLQQIIQRVLAKEDLS